MKKHHFDGEQKERRDKHLAIGPLFYCAFFGFENDKELENKIYNDLDVLIEEHFGDWVEEHDVPPFIIDYFKKENINNVIFGGSGAFCFYKIDTPKETKKTPREYYAGQALAGMSQGMAQVTCANPEQIGKIVKLQSKLAVLLADALIAELEGGK